MTSIVIYHESLFVGVLDMCDVSTSLAWDDIDRLKATLSGEGTSHRVNGIAVQARHFGPQPLIEQSLGCNQLWYKHSVITAEKFRLSNSTAQKYLLTKTSVDGIEWICQSCYKHLKKYKIPPCAAKNEMSFPAKPDFFYLNELQCRMLAPRLAFQKLLQAPRGNQFKINANVVNVPAEVNNTVNMLPRLPQENETIKVQSKRRLEYKSSVLSLNVRPNKILQAANWLATNSILYTENGISFSTERATSCNTNLSQNKNKTGDVSQANEQISGSEDINQLDDWTEDDAEIPVGVTDILLTVINFL